MPGSNKCLACGCHCNFCGHEYSLEYHHEIEELQSRIKEQRATIKNLENELSNVRESTMDELARLRDELGKQKDRYDRLYDSHKKQCKVNHLLEHNLISSADKFIEESDDLRKQIENLTTELSVFQAALGEAKEESELYKRECQMAVHLLQTNPSVFRTQTWDTIPPLLQDRLTAAASPEELYQLLRRESHPNLYKYMTAASGGLGVTIPSSVVMANTNGGAVGCGDSVNNVSIPPHTISSASGGISVDRLASLLGQNAAASGLLASSRFQKFVCTRCRLSQTFATIGTQTTGLVSLLPSMTNMSDGTVDIQRPLNQLESKPAITHTVSSTSSRRVGRVLDI